MWDLRKPNDNDDYWLPAKDNSIKHKSMEKNELLRDLQITHWAWSLDFWEKRKRIRKHILTEKEPEAQGS